MPTPLIPETESSGNTDSPVELQQPDYSGTTDSMFSSGASVATDPPVPAASSPDIEDDTKPKETVPAASLIPNVLENDSEEGEEEKEDVKGKDTDKKAASADPDKTKGKEDKKETAAERRKYEGIDPEDANILKKAPNHVFSALAPRLKLIPALTKENEELKKELANSNVERDYMNPDGFKLTPEYTSLSNARSNLETEVEFFREALKLAEQNKPVPRLRAKTDDLSKDDMGYYTDPKDTIPANEARAYALEQLTAAKARLEHFTLQQNSYKENYLNQNKSFLEMAKGAASKYFPYLDDSSPEVQSNPKIKEELTAVRQLLGPLSKGLGGELTARAIYAAQHIYRKYQELAAKYKTHEDTINNAKRADPLRYGTTAKDDRKSTDVDPEDIYKGVKDSDFDPSADT